ncbi:MAG: hypothetical protein FJ319_04975 [SAR202 cluster bacterium]|nr:hypothetical protein [SAR202 cluster bacterium]
MPAKPKLRPVDPKWVQHRGQPYLFLRDPLKLSEKTVLVPQYLVPLLALCDGTRDLTALRTSLALRAGIELPPSQVRKFIAELGAAFVLDSDKYRQAAADAL